jgi:hypothetical protein
VHNGGHESRAHFAAAIDMGTFFYEHLGCRVIGPVHRKDERRKTMLVDGIDCRRVIFEPFGQLLGVGAVRLHPQVQGLEALEEDPGVERAEGRPGGTQETHHFFHLLAATGDYTAHATTLAVDELGRRMHHHVGAQLQRLLQGGRAEAVRAVRSARAASGKVPVWTGKFQ